jgi:hypothetical protein
MAKPTAEDARLVVEFAKLGAESKLTEAVDWMWSDDFVPNYEEFVKKYPVGSKEHSRVRQICNFYETVGALWKQGLFNEELLFDWLYVTGPWERVKGFALGLRKAADNDSIYELFEAMAQAQQQASAKVPVGAASR